MQQTDKYKLNKPGVDDPIAIAPLNENMDKIEAALTSEAAALRAEAVATAAALDERVTVLEATHMVVGSYVGTGTDTGDSQTFDLGFTPKLVLVRSAGSSGETITITNAPIRDASCDVLKIVPDGFFVNRVLTRGLNTSGYNYYFFAIG